MIIAILLLGGVFLLIYGVQTLRAERRAKAPRTRETRGNTADSGASSGTWMYWGVHDSSSPAHPHRHSESENPSNHDSTSDGGGCSGDGGGGD